MNDSFDNWSYARRGKFIVSSDSEGERNKRLNYGKGHLTDFNQMAVGRVRAVRRVGGGDCIAWWGRH